MKFLVLSACVALSTAAVITHPNGAMVPADTWDVKAAKAAHIKAGGAGTYAVGPAVAQPAAVTYVAGTVVAQPAAVVPHPNGAMVPADTWDVKAAKAAHVKAGGADTYAVGPAVAQPAVVTYAVGPTVAQPAAVVSHPNGAMVPTDTWDVKAAKAAHVKAGGASRYAVGPAVAQPAAVTYAARPVVAQPAAVVSHPNGAMVPADTWDVKVAKAAHVKAGGAGKYAVGPVVAQPAAVTYAAGPAVAQPAAVISHPNGAMVPADIWDVKAAKAAHVKAGGAGTYAMGPAHIASSFHGMVAHPNGAMVPVEPAGVVVARAAHLAKHPIV